jgi:ribulose kinase
MEKKYVLALDQGTTSSRAILFDRNGRIINMSQKEFTQFYPAPGWVEHNPLEIWETQINAAKEAIKDVDASIASSFLISIPYHFSKCSSTGGMYRVSSVFPAILLIVKTISSLSIPVR